jgi:hypothetical protein
MHLETTKVITQQTKVYMNLQVWLNTLCTTLPDITLLLCWVNGQNCWVQDGHNMKLRYTNKHANPYSTMKEICVWPHTALTNSINFVWGPFSPPSHLIKCCDHPDRPQFHEKQFVDSEYCHMLVYPRCCSAVYPIYIRICFKWIVPGTKTWSENEHIYKGS